MQCISSQKIQNITLRTINSLSSKIFIKSGIKFNSFMLNMMLAKSWQQKYVNEITYMKRMVGFGDISRQRNRFGVADVFLRALGNLAHKPNQATTKLKQN